MRTLILCTALLPAVWLASGGVAPAQVIVQQARTDVPLVLRVMPAGFERGQNVEVVVTGERLEGLSGLLAPAGVQLTRVVAIEEKQARLEVAVAADAPLGIFPFHVLCKSGLSNPRLVRVDDLPQAIETEDNNSAQQAMTLELPLAVSGVLTSTDVDFFRFEAAAGQQVVFDVEARRLGSALRPVATLLDARGRELQRSQGGSPGIRPDVRLVHTFGEAGTYLVRINDLVYEGAEFNVYHLRVGTFAFAESMFPLGGQRGTKPRVSLEGGHLDSPLVHEVDLTGDIAAQCFELHVPLGSSSIASPLLFAVGDYPETMEQEPNQSLPEANQINAPVTINGRIAAPGDRDCFRFHAAAGQRLIIRVLANGLGSPLDAIITVMNADGGELATADDRAVADRVPPVVRSAIPAQTADDPLLEFVAPAEGDYVLAIDDCYGAGGPAHAYRIEVAQARTDFELLAQPSLSIGVRPANMEQQQQQAQVLAEFSGAGTGSLTIDRGGSAAIIVRAVRSGYNGLIDLAVEGLPAGVQAAPAQIAAGQNETVINLAAEFEAPSTAAFVRVVGTGQLDGGSQGGPTTLVRTAVQPVVTTALPVNGIAERELDVIALGVSQQGAELAVRGELAASLVQGGTTVLNVAVKRREGYTGPVTVQLINLPTGLTAEPVALAADQSQGQTNLLAGLDLTPGRHVLLIEGTLTAEGKEQPILATVPIQFDVLPVVGLELASQQVEVAQGESTTVEIAIRRNGPSPIPIELSIAPLPRGVTVAQTAIPPDADRFALVLEAGEQATASPIRRIVQIKAKAVVGQAMIELPTLRFALKVTKP